MAATIETTGEWTALSALLKLNRGTILTCKRMFESKEQGRVPLNGKRRHVVDGVGDQASRAIKVVSCVFYLFPVISVYIMSRLL